MRFAGVAFLLLLLPLLGGLQPVRAGTPAQAATPSPATAYTLRERRRVQAILRLRLLELRLAGLERVRAVIERRLPIDTLLAPAPGPSPILREH
jgi:hypothetical protein